MTDVVIIGAGGMGREVRDWFLQWAAVQGEQWRFRGFVDDGTPDEARLARLDARHLGGIDDLSEHSDAMFYVGVGSPATRAKLAQAATGQGLRAGPPLLHPTAVVGSDVVLGDGTVVCPGVLMTTNLRIGEHVLLNIGCTVGHDTVIEDFATVNPGATISGDVRLGEGVLIGTNAAVNQGLQVGAGAVVGSGAAAVKNVEPGVTAVGVPARPLPPRG